VKDGVNADVNRYNIALAQAPPRFSSFCVCVRIPFVYKPAVAMDDASSLSLCRLFTVTVRGSSFATSGSLVDPASSHMLVSKIKPCMSKYKRLYCETANGSFNQLWFI